MIIDYLNRTTFVTLFRDALSDRGTLWLHVSVLAYMALLPFNALGFKVFSTQSVVKFTEVAVLAIIVFGTIAYFQKQLTIRKAYWLYAFLILQAVVQFISLIGTTHAREGLPVAIAVASYSVLVFVLVNTIRSQALVKAILVVMAGTTLVIVSHSISIFFLQDWVFNTRMDGQSSIIGNEMPHYLALGLILHGIGLVYLAFTERVRKWRVFFWVFIALWLYVIILTASKTAQISLVLFFLALFIALYKEYRKVSFMTFIFITAIAIQANIVPIKNQYLAARHTVAEQINEVTYPIVVTTLKTQRAVVARIVTIKDNITREVQRFASAFESKRLAVAPSPAKVAMIPQQEMSSVSKRVEARIPTTKETISQILFPKEPTPLPGPEFINEYSEENLFNDRWRGGFGVRNTEVRVRGFVAGWYMGVSRPLLGVGVGQTPYSIGNYVANVRLRLSDPSYLSFIPFRDKILSQTEFDPWQVGVYNIFLYVWSETGLLGLFAFVGILSVVLSRALIAFWKTWRTEQNHILYFLLPTFFAFLLFSQFNPFWVHPWLWTMLALLYAAADQHDDMNQGSTVAMRNR